MLQTADSPAPPRIKAWQWPNLLALDAALVACLWLLAFSAGLKQPVAPAAYLVLGCSVWLTYTADRWLDAVRRHPDTLASLRHRFIKRHCRGIGAVWGAVLLLDGILALWLLAPPYLVRGLLVLAACLLYLLLSQYRASRFFPKEPCVALIFAAGTLLFLPSPPLRGGIAYGLLCLINCLLIGRKERVIDEKLGTRALASDSKPPLLGAMYAVGFTCILLPPAGLVSVALWISAAALGLLALPSVAAGIGEEAFRVLADATLLLGPGLALIAFVVIH